MWESEGEVWGLWGGCANTVEPNTVMAAVLRTIMCGQAWSCRSMLSTPLLWYKLYTKASIPDFCLLQYNCRISLLFPRKEVHNISIILISKDYSLESRRNLQFLNPWRHYVDCHLDSGSEFEPSFQPVWQLSIRSHLLHCRISGKWFPLLFACTSQHLW